MELRKELWQEVLEYRRQNKFAYLNYRFVVVRDHEREREGERERERERERQRERQRETDRERV